MQQTCIWWNLVVTEDLTNQWADSCVRMQMDVCYPVLARLSPICSAFSVPPEPLSPRCGQGSCCPEPVPVWNGGWHIRAPGALSLWGNAAVPLLMTESRGKEILHAAAVCCSALCWGGSQGKPGKWSVKQQLEQQWWQGWLFWCLSVYLLDVLRL